MYTSFDEQPNRSNHSPLISSEECSVSYPRSGILLSSSSLQSSTKKRKQSSEKPILQRNQACLSCRKKKLKCDAVKPTCGTCARKHLYALQHRRQEQPSPVAPICTYEGDMFSNGFEEAGARETTPNSISTSAPASDGPTKEDLANQVELLKQKIREMEETQNQVIGVAGLNMLANPNNPPQIECELVSELNNQRYVHGFSQPALPIASRPGPSSRLKLSNASYPSLSQSLSTCSVEQTNEQSIDVSDIPLDTFPPMDPSKYQPSSSATDPFTNLSQFSTPLLDTLYPSLGTFPEELLTSSPNVLTSKPDSVIDEHLISANIELQTTSIDSSETSDATAVHTLEQTDIIEEGSAEKANQVLMSLLYPGWPPHLPDPMMLEHIVESFFRYIASVAGIFNKGRFMARLTLPPSHHDFPHPAVLHAICAVTSRFLGIVSSTPPANTAFDGRKVEKPWSRSLLNPVDPKPVWDGLGPKPPGVLGGFFGRDGDFGQIHFSWGKLYIHDSKMFASEWIACIQALVILSHYCYQEARWIEAWSMIGDAAQMMSPLGLQTRKCHTFSTNPRRGPVSLLPPPKDEVEMTERQNLFTCLFGLDTLAASTSGWAPAIDLSNVTSWIPTALATVDPTHQPSCQDFQSADLFSSHLAETTAYSLLVKSTILVRRVNDYVRLAAERDVDEPTETVEFKQLDRWTTDFRSTFPPALRDPFRSPATGDDGRSVDETLLSAHTNSLLAIIQLHDPYVNNSSPTDGSRTRIQEAVEYLLMMIHQLHATSFDLSTMHPRMGFTWFIAARCLARLISTSDPSPEVYRISLRNSISVLLSTSTSIGTRLPVGLRHKWIIDRLVADFEGRM